MRLDYTVKAFVSAMQLKTEKAYNRLSATAASLNAMSPLSVLARGYSISSVGDKPVSSVKNISVGDDLKLVLKDGTAHCKVTDISESDKLSGGK